MRTNACHERMHIPTYCMCVPNLQFSVLSKRLLSEEPVRCSILIMELRQLPNTRDGRERTRQKMRVLLEQHVAEGCPLPVSLPIDLRTRTLRLLTKTQRRKVMFADEYADKNQLITEVTEHRSTND